MPVIAPREFHPGKTLFVGSVIVALIAFHWIRYHTGRYEAEDNLTRWTGQTMGTYYAISVVDWDVSDEEHAEHRQRITDYLVGINQQMSTYIADSEISRFNATDSVEPFPVSPEFFAMTQTALEWAERTGGAFDPTLDPLITLWGFGAKEVDLPPSPTAIEDAMARKGFDRIQVVEQESAIRKDAGYIQLNLNAIAKGDAVDGVAALLKEAGAENIYVEIGGDVVAFGVNPDGNPWRIGVEWPVAGSVPGQNMHGIAHIRNGALAGSGEYRQLVELPDGTMISHIIDPRTGAPVQHDLIAVNVWAETCIAADAVATALIVMGYEEGRLWIETQEDIEAIFFTRTGDDDMDVSMSSGFAEVTNYQPL